MNVLEGSVRRALAEVSRRWLPRLLTQVCRDPGCSQHGCFDRDWWHYRIRDFPSIILQQGGASLAAAAELPENRDLREGLRRLAGASCDFWNRRACRRGAFEEYYPWEQGYPPLAFSTLAVLQMVESGVADPASMRPGIQIAARQLLARFEARAANQQMAGLAALARCRKLYPDLVPSSVFNALSERSLKLQDAEGWFQEYGGPDLGYLSVTVDCLWDLFDATGDPCYRQAIQPALTAMERLTAPLGTGSIGMHNARNTDYILPYGVVRAGGETGFPDLRARFFAAAESADHFFAAIDDRYLCHYVGRSLFRTLAWLERQSGAERNEQRSHFSGSADGPVTASGHVLNIEAPGDE